MSAAKRHNRQSFLKPQPQRDGVTMSTGLYGIEWIRFAALGSHFADRPAANYFRTGLIALIAVVTAGCGGWLLLSGQIDSTAGGEPAPVAMVAESESVSAATASQGEPASGPGIVPTQMTPVDGLKISSQHWRRGGLGSNALVSFTLRNTNDYAVKDIEISCAFSRRDGSHLTNRTRVIHSTVRKKSRKTFARMHVGFVNVNADRIRCSPVSASQI